MFTAQVLNSIEWRRGWRWPRRAYALNNPPTVSPLERLGLKTSLLRLQNPNDGWPFDSEGYYAIKGVTKKIRLATLRTDIAVVVAPTPPLRGLRHPSTSLAQLRVTPSNTLYNSLKILLDFLECGVRVKKHLRL